MAILCVRLPVPTVDKARLVNVAVRAALKLKLLGEIRHLNHLSAGAPFNQRGFLGMATGHLGVQSRERLGAGPRNGPSIGDNER